MKVQKNSFFFGKKAFFLKCVFHNRLFLVVWTYPVIVLLFAREM